MLTAENNNCSPWVSIHPECLPCWLTTVLIELLVRSFKIVRFLLVISEVFKQIRGESLGNLLNLNSKEEAWRTHRFHKVSLSTIITFLLVQLLSAGDESGSAPGLVQICYPNNRTFLTCVNIRRVIKLNMYGEYTRNQILALANANKTPTKIVSVLREENIIIVRTTVARIIRRTREKMQGQQHQDCRGRPWKASKFDIYMYSVCQKLKKHNYWKGAPGPPVSNVWIFMQIQGITTTWLLSCLFTLYAVFLHSTWFSSK